MWHRMQIKQVKKILSLKLSINKVQLRFCHKSQKVPWETLCTVSTNAFMKTCQN